jgi:hypothetical protein
LGRGGHSYCFSSEIPWWKMKCETMCCHGATASSFIAKVLGKSFTYFHAVAVKCHSSMCQDGFLLKNPLDIKEIDKHALDFDLLLSSLFRSRWILTFCVRPMLSSPNACLIIGRVSVALFPRVAQNLMLFLCQIHREIIWGQIHDTK